MVFGGVSAGGKDTGGQAIIDQVMLVGAGGRWEGEGGARPHADQ